MIALHDPLRWLALISLLGCESAAVSTHDASSSAVVAKAPPRVDAMTGFDAAREAGPAPDAARETGPAPDPARVPNEAGSTTACAALATGIAVDDRELAGFPPYAVDECVLVYVSRPSPNATAGDLILRDLTTGAETMLATALESPRRPAIAGPIIAWEATIAGRSAVRVSYQGRITTLQGGFDHAGEPRAATDAVVFTAWSTTEDLGDTDVWLYLPASGELTAVVTGPGQQRFADVSETHVAVSDFSEDPDGHYDAANDLADIVLYDRVRHTISSRPLPGKQAFPMLGAAGFVAYLHWQLAEVHPEPKLGAYHLRSGAIGSDPLGDRELANVVTSFTPYIRPAARAGIIEWVAGTNNPYQLIRSPADMSTPPVAVRDSPTELYAPAPARDFTVLATRAAATAVAQLQAVPR